MTDFWHPHGQGGSENESSNGHSLDEDRFRLGALGIVRSAYRTVWEQFPAQVGLSVVLLVPLIVLLLVALTLLPRRDAAIVNGTVAARVATPLDLAVVGSLGLLVVVAGLLAFAA